MAEAKARQDEADRAAAQLEEDEAMVGPQLPGADVKGHVAGYGGALRPGGSPWLSAVQAVGWCYYLYRLLVPDCALLTLMLLIAPV